MIYEVVVGNIGRVYRGSDRREANRSYAVYLDQFKQGYGRAAGESVTLFEDGEPIREHEGKLDKQQAKKES